MSELEKNIQTDNKRIAKNAIILYIRMIFTLLIGLYTSRVILQALGVEDYGIYNVVGGFVSMFSIISGALQGSVSRYLTYELGTGNKEKLQKLFSSSFYVLAGISILVVLATESIGVWYLYNKMVIPADRMDAAFWCFQLSLAAFVLSLLSTPYSSSIISHERMDVYAYMSIADTVMKLLICYAVMVSPIDKLVFYAILIFLIGVLDQIIYWTFCKRKFEECRLKPVFEKNLFKQLFSFAGWNFIGSSAGVIKGQGCSLIINAFGGPTVNAANGIAASICNVVIMFVGNFTQAFNPQITKRYASKEYESLMKLLTYGSKYSYYMMLVIALPVYFNAHFILKLWLGVVPDYTVEFTRWTLIYLLADTLSKPIITVKNANGDIRNYQIVVGMFLLLALPLSYIGLKCGLSVTFVAAVNAIIAILTVFVRIYMIRGDFPTWSSTKFIKDVVINVTIVTVFSTILPSLSYSCFVEGWQNLIVTTAVSILSSSLVIYYVGCSKNERTIILNKSLSLIKQIRAKYNL